MPSRELAIKRYALKLAVAVVAAAFLTASVDRNQAAAAICSSPHCYSILKWTQTDTYTGAIGLIRADILNVGDQCYQRVIADMWLGTNYQPLPPPSISDPSAWWVEQGIKHGFHFNGACGNGYEWFVGYATGANRYSEYYPAITTTLGTTYTSKMEYMGTGSIAYGFYRNGNLLTRSSGNPCCTKWLEIGGESDTMSIRVEAEASGLQKRFNGVYGYGWGGVWVYNGPWSRPTWVTVGRDFTYSGCCVF